MKQSMPVNGTKSGISFRAVSCLYLCIMQINNYWRRRASARCVAGPTGLDQIVGPGYFSFLASGKRGGWRIVVLRGESRRWAFYLKYLNLGGRPRGDLAFFNLGNNPLLANTFSRRIKGRVPKNPLNS